MNPTRRNALTVLLGRFLSLLVSLLYVILIPRLLGPEAYGYYSYWFAQLFLLVVLFDLGSTETLKRFLPSRLQQNGEHAWDLIRGVVAVKLPVILLTTLLLQWYDDGLGFLAIYGAAILATFSWLLSDLSYAANDMVKYSFYHVFRKTIRIPVILAGFLLFAERGILLGLLISEALTLIVFVFVTLKLLPARGTISKPRFQFRPLYFGAVIFIATLLYFAIGRIPVLYAKTWEISFSEIGFLALAIDISFFTLRELFFAISESIQTRQVLAYESGDQALLADSHKKVLVYTLTLMVPALLAISNSLEVLLLLLGEQYRAALGIVDLLLPVAAINVVGYIYRQLLIITGRQWAILTAYLAGLAMFVTALFFVEAANIRTLAELILLSCFTAMLVMLVQTATDREVFEDEIILIKFAFLAGFGYWLLTAIHTQVSDATMMLVMVGLLPLFIAATIVFKLVSLAEWREAWNAIPLPKAISKVGR